ncbi:unnamed protein product [Prorocentrum cordatum]|uniref:Uncharacterized protein n=1 Tax=Prorocentrum cordatum TaxID=2364126 RepID=A0ABN9S187_9DINO|nr:unnamed protein product [Polarella glacialis]
MEIPATTTSTIWNMPHMPKISSILTTTQKEIHARLPIRSLFWAGAKAAHTGKGTRQSAKLHVRQGVRYISSVGAVQELPLLLETGNFALQTASLLCFLERSGVRHCIHKQASQFHVGW